MQSKYTMLEGVTAKGSPVFLLGDQVERVADVNGKPGYRLTDEGVKAGLVRLEWVTGQYNDRGMHTLLGRWVFKHDDIWGYMARPFYFSLAFLVVALFGSEGQGASDAVQTWPQVARAGAGDDFGVQREAGPVEGDACATAGRGAVHQ